VSFVRVATLDDLWAGEMRGLLVGGARVLLLNCAGTVHAYEDRCAHKGVQLSKGRLDGTTLTCSAHEWKYDASTGTGQNPEVACLRRFAVKVEGDDIYVDVEDGRQLQHADAVGPVLQAGPLGDAVIAAIRELNPQTTVLDRGAYLRVLVPGRCVVTRERIERHAGTMFRLPSDLESIMPSFKGRLTITEEEVTWELTPAPARGGQATERDLGS
jgi:toluene monooxygenase system ferredoxin subunit